MKHLTDTQIQEILDGQLHQKNNAIKNHLDTCPLCYRTLKEYQLLTQELRKEPGYRLPENLAALIGSRLPEKTDRFPLFSPPEYLLIVIGLPVVLTILYFWLNVSSLAEFHIQFFSIVKESASAIWTAAQHITSFLNGHGIFLFLGIGILITIRIIDRIIQMTGYHEKLG